MSALDRILRSQPILSQKGVIPALRIAKTQNPPKQPGLLLKKSHPQRKKKKSPPIAFNPGGNFSWTA